MKIISNTLVIFLLAFCYTVPLNSQVLKPAERVNLEKAGGEHFQKVDPFKIAPQKRDLIKELTPGTEYDLLAIDKEILGSIGKEKPDAIHLAIPSVRRNRPLSLELVKVDIFTPDFELKLASGRKVLQSGLGVHYQGIAEGDENSLVAISIYDNEVMGFISTGEGNLVLGKLEGEEFRGEHILYNDKEVLQNLPFDCEMEGDGIPYPKEQLEWNDSKRGIGDCVRYYIEVDNDIYTDKGGAAGTTTFITGLLNQVIAIYNNENIGNFLHELVLWDMASPYNGVGSSGMLSSFQANTGAFDGDLAQLLSYKASGGIAAGFTGFCNPDPDLSKSYSSILSTFSQVPTYSWSVMVVTHEFGHLYGSRHTHACVWNQNATAIDGCYFTEGFCPRPAIPQSGGTVMSYCHLQSVGINLNNGFGPQPGNVLRYNIAKADCMTGCITYTCSDNILNGNETGVDCGGPDCDPCPDCDNGVQDNGELGVDCGGSCAPCPCTGQDVALTIVFDDVPFEVSWEITSNGLVYASSPGGDYYHQPKRSTVIEEVCLNYGCYEFTIYDSYWNGICCAYGQGSYTLRDENGQVLASGGTYGASETTQFCLVDPYCESGGNNQYGWISNVTAFNGGLSNTSGADPNGYGNYRDMTVCNPNTDRYHFYMDNDGPMSSSPAYWKAWVDWDQSLTFEPWEAVLQKQTNAGFYSTVYVPSWIPDGEYIMRISMNLWTGYPGPCETGGYGEYEDYTICKGQNNQPPALRVSDLSIFSSVEPDIKVFPNPVRQQLNMELISPEEKKFNIQIVNTLGKVVLLEDKDMHAGENFHQLDTEDLQAGLYFLKVQSGNWAKTVTFTKSE